MEFINVTRMQAGYTLGLEVDVDAHPMIVAGQEATRAPLRQGLDDAESGRQGLDRRHVMRTRSSGVNRVDGGSVQHN